MFDATSDDNKNRQSFNPLQKKHTHTIHFLYIFVDSISPKSHMIRIDSNVTLNKPHRPNPETSNEGSFS